MILYRQTVAMGPIGLRDFERSYSYYHLNVSATHLITRITARQKRDKSFVLERLNCFPVQYTLLSLLASI